MPIKTLGVLCAIPLALSACGGPGRVQSVQSNPTLRADEAKAQALVQTCVQKSHLRRKAFIACLAPPGQQEAMKLCASQAFAKNGVLTKKQRKRLEAALTTCVLKVKR